MSKEKDLDYVDFLTKDVHIWPDFHGNRSPIADSTLKGLVCGLSLSVDEDNLAVMYLAAIQAVCYGSRHILDTLVKSGYKTISSIFICGGLTKNPLFMQTQADVVNLPVVYPEEKESVLLGSAVLGACAAKHFKNITTAIRTMGGQGVVIQPNKEVIIYHDKKYKVFLKMLEDQLKYREIMH